MKNIFETPVFRKAFINAKSSSGKVIKKTTSELRGTTRIVIEEDDTDMIKLMVIKDETESVKEIKFTCSCGCSKSILLDYTE
jgi:hypothetical protein